MPDDEASLSQARRRGCRAFARYGGSIAKRRSEIAIPGGHH